MITKTFKATHRILEIGPEDAYNEDNVHLPLIGLEGIFMGEVQQDEFSDGHFIVDPKSLTKAQSDLIDEDHTYFYQVKVEEISNV